MIPEDLGKDYEIPEDLGNYYRTPGDLGNDYMNSKPPSVVRPEILTVVDSALYNKLGRDRSAIDQYIRNFWSAVNLRYKTITNPRIELHIAGIIISKNS